MKISERMRVEAVWICQQTAILIEATNDERAKISAFSWHIVGRQGGKRPLDLANRCAGAVLEKLGFVPAPVVFIEAAQLLMEGWEVGDDVVVIR